MPTESPQRDTEVLDGLILPTRFRRPRPGSRPGIDPSELAGMPVRAPVPVTVIDYGPEKVETQKIENIEEFVRGRRDPWVRVRWINVDGLSDPSVIRALAIKYDLHPLAIEDLLNPNQRPKIETYASSGEHHARIFIIVRMVQLIEGRLQSEQISLLVGHHTVLTFQESPGDVWDPIRQRIAKAGSKMRELDASYLVYALIDAIVDHCFPVLEHYGERLEELEELVLDYPTRQTLEAIHDLKRDLLLLRRAVWPMREVVNALLREPHECISDTTRTYLRDVYDHAVQIMDIVETYREIAASLTETYMSAMSNRLAEVMRVLTVIGTIFLPLTFLAGVYGMNMPIPENHWAGSYPMFWGVCIVLAGGMLMWFHRKGWI